MRKRRWLLLAGAGVLVGIGTLAWWLLHLPRVTDAAYQQIDLGMTLSEVEAIIGGPPGDYGGTPRNQYLPRELLVTAPVFTTIVWRDLERDGNMVHLDDELGTDTVPVAVTAGMMPNSSWGAGVRHLLSNEEHQALRPPVRTVLWTGPDYAIAVQLDAADRVVNACLAKNIREPGPWERFVARCGIK